MTRDKVGIVNALVEPERLETLRQAAQAAEGSCYPRYSGFRVLAAVERSDGLVYGGANVEVVNFSLTKHAEEAAVMAAIAAGALTLGDRWLKTVYVQGALPCGSCRQFLWEWSAENAVCLVDHETRVDEYRLGDLLPYAFDPKVLPDLRRKHG